MPEELSRMIQDFARPRTDPQWRKGSVVCQQTHFGEFYWEMFDGPWYDFNHKEDIMIAYFIHGMNTMPIAYMLRTLFYHRGNDLCRLIYDYVMNHPDLSDELFQEMMEFDRDTLFVANLERN